MNVTIKSVIYGLAVAMPIFGCAAAGLLTGNASAGLVEPPAVGTLQKAKSKPLDDRDRARATVQYINHLNYIIAKLGDMNDLFALQQEYENLTDDNLNLESIPDELTMLTIVQLMEEVKRLQMTSVQAIHAQVVFEQKKRQAIWKAVPNPGFIVASKDWASMSVAVASAVLTSIQNYFEARAEASNELLTKGFELSKDKLDYINEINKELFESQWRLMHKYGISDSERVTRAEARVFLDFADIVQCKTDDKNRNRLLYELFRRHESEMRNLPYYWMTRATAAGVIIGEEKYREGHESQAYYEDVLKSCREYFELYKTAPIVRRDMDACAMALLYVSTAMKVNPELAAKDRKLVVRWLEFVMNTVRIPQWETKFAVAMIYRQIGDDASAKEILKTAFSEVYACVKIWEESNKTKNIFRKTPALEKAFSGYKADAADDWAESLALWPNWREEAEKLVPYDGYVMLAGALYDMGEKDVFKDCKCTAGAGQVKASLKLIQGEYAKRFPIVRFVSGDENGRSVRGGKLMIESNGLWEEDLVPDRNVKVWVDGDSCPWRGDGYMVRMANGTVKLCVCTRMGIKLYYEYSFENLENPTKVDVSFPWSRPKSAQNSGRGAK